MTTLHNKSSLGLKFGSRGLLLNFLSTGQDHADITLSGVDSTPLGK